ncbi:MAG: hypothetical protein FJ284_03350 [Planctomycetes bacterium]|nr:hypothetical protein [Planctomycetota bacterium]
MGIVAFCPQGHRVKVKDHLAGRKGICPECGTRFRIPLESQETALVPGGVGPTAATPGHGPTPTTGESAGGLPVARIVSLDGDAAAALPRALPLSPPGGRRP